MGSICSTDHGEEDDFWCLPFPQFKRKEKLLSRVPGRICSNGSTTAACAFTQQGTNRSDNQDAMVVWENYASTKDTSFCGVFDGHGLHGHLVSRRVRDALPSKLMAIWKAQMRGEGYGYEESEYWSVATMTQTSIINHPSSPSINDFLSSVQSHHVSPNMNHPNSNNLTIAMWKYSILKCFNLMDKDLRTHPTIDCYDSGTTAVILLKQGEELIIGNLGDSRAVLGTAQEEDDQMLEAIHQLTTDHTPSVPWEAERITRCKGRVLYEQEDDLEDPKDEPEDELEDPEDEPEDEPEMARVYMPYDDFPGLAMSRAFGDFCLKDYGLISVPDITYRRLTPKDQFVILATDGIWGVLSNKEAVEVVSSAPTKATAARSLVEAAVRAWRLQVPDYVDDCSVVCLFFNNHNNTTQCSKFKFMESSRPKSYTPQHEVEEEEEEEEEEKTVV